MSRQRSERRQRTRLVALRLTPEEHQAIAAAAHAREESLSLFIRLAAIASAAAR
jgi:uncharacterized protein (DUF1778 family)